MKPIAFPGRRSVSRGLRSSRAGNHLPAHSRKAGDLFDDRESVGGGEVANCYDNDGTGRAIRGRATPSPTNFGRTPYPDNAPGTHRGGLPTENEAAAAVAAGISERQREAYRWLDQR